MLIVVIVILSAVIVSCLLIIRNLLLKVERYEEDIQLKDEYLLKLKDMVESSEARVRTLDVNGAFESDDEVGYFFKALKEVMFVLAAYFKNYEDTK